MATVTKSRSTDQDTSTSMGPSPYRLTVAQFLKMINAGIFPPEAHVELLEGNLVEMMVKGDPHDNTLDALSECLRPLIPEGWLHREDKSLQLGPRTRLEPDVAIVRGPRTSFYQRTPRAKEAALVIEVASSSYPYDRGEKWRAYATARIPVYWIVNLDVSRIEVYTDPGGRGKSAAYRKCEIFDKTSVVPVWIEGVEVGRLELKDIFA